MVTLAISDAPGDDPSIIASGPTVPDASSCAKALAILQRYGIDMPGAIMSLLAQGALETPKPVAPIFNGHEVHLIATPQQSLQAAAQAARAAGLAADTDGIDGIEDYAGAYVAPDTLRRALAAGMKLDRLFDRNDAYG